MQIISFSQARNQFKSLIDRVTEDCDATLIHRRTGGNAVVLSESTYNSMMETFYLLQSPTNAARLMQGLEFDRKGLAQQRELLES